MPKKLSQRQVTMKKCEKFLRNKKLWKYAKPYTVSDSMKIHDKAKAFILSYGGHVPQTWWYYIVLAESRKMKLSILLGIKKGLFSEKENEMLRKAVRVIRFPQGFNQITPEGHS